MQKNILITGATDGIGLGTARELSSLGHNVLVHGRNPEKLIEVEKKLTELSGGGEVKSYVADLSSLIDVEMLAQTVIKNHDTLDVLINNAGIFATSDPVTGDGLDVRFVVNAIAPYLLTKRLLPLLGDVGRVVNLSSAAQSPVDSEVLAGRLRLSEDFSVYAQSKLALTMWSRALALSLGDEGPAIIAVNPGSMLGTKMVREGFGVEGKDIRIGVEVLLRAALADDFASASGKYFDNDAGRFSSPHPDALDPRKCDEIRTAIEAVLSETP